jgi:hypothetical protein
MESDIMPQLNLLLVRIPYDEDIFGVETPTYELTSDIEINENSLYYTRSGEESNYVYTLVDNPVIEDIAIYYERTDENFQVYLKVLNNLLVDSKHIALSIKYPYEDFSNMELPVRYYNWQLRCCVELYNYLGSENVKSYSENGVAWTKDGGNISNDLKQEIVPKVGRIREVVEIDEETA